MFILFCNFIMEAGFNRFYYCDNLFKHDFFKGSTFESVLSMLALYYFCQAVKITLIKILILSFYQFRWYCFLKVHEQLFCALACQRWPKQVCWYDFWQLSWTLFGFVFESLCTDPQGFSSRKTKTVFLESLHPDAAPAGVFLRTKTSMF